MGVDVLYVADTTSAANGGVRKYVFNGLTWALAWRANSFTSGASNLTAACQYVTAIPTGTDVVVLCSDTGGTRIIKYLDVGGVSATAPVGALLVTSPTNTAFRGLAPAAQ